MKKIQTVHFLILVILLTAAVAGGVLFLSYTLQQQTNTLAATMQTVADEQAVITEQSNLATVLSETEDDRAKLDRYILQGDDGTAAFLSDMDTLAEQLSVELTTETLEVRRPEGATFNILRVSFAFSGNEGQVNQLIQLFESLPYAGEITNVEYLRTRNPATGRNTVSGLIGLELSIAAL